MAKELFNAKVESEVKDKMLELTERYTNEGIIREKGDIVNIAAELLERNLTVQTPRAVIGIEELDQLTSRINRLFVNTIEQNNTHIQVLKVEHEEKFEKAKITIDSLLEEKLGLNEELTESKAKLQELTELTKVNQKKAEELENDNKEKSKYITLLEAKNDENQQTIKELLQFSKQNKELKKDSSQKAEEIDSLNKRIKELETSLKQQEQDHKMNIQQLEFSSKDALLNLDKELTEKFHKQIDDIRNKRDEYIEKYDNKLAALQEKYDAIFAERQRLEAENKILNSQLDTEKKDKGDK
ncbi:MAG: hypothetical protein WAM95_21520 [Bacillus sp. (in: firmicutes)]